MNRLLCFITSLFLQLNVSAQDNWCATEQPRKASTNFAASRITDNEQVLTIPVVVHVIRTQDVVDAKFNPSDEYINAVIRFLNESFAANHSNYPDTLTGGVDTKIRFVMATRSPDCKPSNGIDRFNASDFPQYVQSGSLQNGLLEKIVWPYDQYFNVLIVHKTPNNAAYGGFISMQGFQGIVIPAEWFEANTGLIAHETGHFLNLYHTFTDGDMNCPGNINCQYDGDMICDTEPHRINTNCNLLGSINPCTNLPFGPTVKNFMSYSNIGCIDRFTPQQKTRMRSALLAYGYTLIDNDNTKPPGLVKNLDADGDILVYPNPSRGKFNFIFKKPLSCNSTISVVTPEGRTIAVFNVKCLTTSLDANFSTFRKGLYFMVLKDESGILSKKIIIQ